MKFELYVVFLYRCLDFLFVSFCLLKFSGCGVAVKGDQQSVFWYRDWESSREACWENCHWVIWWWCATNSRELPCFMYRLCHMNSKSILSISSFLSLTSTLWIFYNLLSIMYFDQERKALVSKILLSTVSSKISWFKEGTSTKEMWVPSCNILSC